MNFPTAAGEVETHKFQLSIVYHLLLFSAAVLLGLDKKSEL